MTVLSGILIGAGVLCCIAAAVWWVRVRHVRSLWHTTEHDSSRVALVLELEHHIQHLEAATTRSG